MQSADRTVERRWLMMTAVRPRASSRNFMNTCYSAEGSSELVGSPRTSIWAGLRKVRTRANGVFCAVIELAGEHGLVLQSFDEAGGVGQVMVDSLRWSSRPKKLISLAQSAVTRSQ